MLQRWQSSGWERDQMRSRGRDLRERSKRRGIKRIIAENPVDTFDFGRLAIGSVFAMIWLVALFT